MSRNAFFSSRSERKHFLSRWYCRKNIKTWKSKYLSWSVLLSTRHYHFPNIFSYCFCMLSDFAKVFEKKVWRVQVAHLHNAARALSSPSRVFNCQQILPKISFVLFDIVIKKKPNRMWFSVALVKFHWFGINWQVINLRAEIVACVLSFRKSRHKPNLENTSKYGFSPDLGGKMAAFWACACKLSWTLLSPARVQPLYGAGRKFRDWTRSSHVDLPCLATKHASATALLRR